MPSTNTTNLELEKQATGESVDLWGPKVNTNWDEIDAVFAADGSGTSVGLKVGAAKTLNATAGALLLPAVNTPAQTADGSVVWDADSNLLTVGDGASRKTMVDTDSTQTLTNKTLTAPTTTSAIIGAASLSVGSNVTLNTDSTGYVCINGFPGAGGDPGTACISIGGGGAPNTNILFTHGQLYVHADGSLRYRSPGGTTTVLGAA